MLLTAGNRDQLSPQILWVQHPTTGVSSAGIQGPSGLPIWISIELWLSPFACRPCCCSLSIHAHTCSPQGKRGVWIKLPSACAAFVPECIQQGFGFHHAKPGCRLLPFLLLLHPPTPRVPLLSLQLPPSVSLLLHLQPK